jgi:hydrogenase nickel incorporation protein HypA/HybF
MHELGIVVKVIDMVEDFCDKNGIDEVDALDLEVGEVSTVVPSYFEDCYRWAIKETKHMKHCALNLIPLKAKSYCRACGKTFDTVKYGRKCPHCQSEDTYLLTGDDVTIRSVRVKEKKEGKENGKRKEG